MASRFRITVLLFAFLCFPLLAWGISPPVPAQPGSYIVDLARVIEGPVKSRLDALLDELERKTTAQVVVLTVDSLEGEPIEQASLDIAHTRWGLGKKGKDNGVLLLVAVNDRKYRFEIGYGLEGVLPDSLVGSIGRQYLVQNFRAGDYSRGVALAVFALAGELARSEGVELGGLSGSPEAAPVPRQDDVIGDLRALGLFAYLLLLPILFVLALLFVKNPGLLMLFLLGGSGGGWGSFGGSGGFGGGGGGGFGGG
ncbi:MAG: TPM domain-containing protein, partial [Thermodesulfovibrionales bacterium]